MGMCVCGTEIAFGLPVSEVVRPKGKLISRGDFNHSTKHIVLFIDNRL